MWLILKRRPIQNIASNNRKERNGAKYDDEMAW